MRSRCRRVGIDVTRRCNWRCKPCYYRHSGFLGKPEDKPIVAVEQELEQGRARGCTHALAVGWGEPALYPHLAEFIGAARQRNLSASIITNGAVGLTRLRHLVDVGLDHFHVSVHGVGKLLDQVVGNPHAFELQGEFLRWLRDSRFPWRSNTVMQKANAGELGATARHIVEHGAFHVVLLGFQPHYEWREPAKMQEVAAHPAELRPAIESAARAVLAADRHLTIRYHPFCHLDPALWRFVVNARHVLYDPWEWDYGHAHLDDAALWQAALGIGANVEIGGEPCSSCAVKLHCGGWNRIYAAGFDGADLQAIQTVPLGAADDPFFFFDQNPANHLTGAAPCRS